LPHRTDHRRTAARLAEVERMTCADYECRGPGTRPGCMFECALAVRRRLLAAQIAEEVG
jgi:hypothetical protein